MDTGLRERRRNRSWPKALKREIVAASLEPGSSVSLVARHYDVNANQVFAWRKRYAAEAAEPMELRLMPVTVTPDPPAEPAPTRAEGLGRVPPRGVADGGDRRLPALAGLVRLRRLAG
jgi:transposase-like protein